MPSRFLRSGAFAVLALGLVAMIPACGEEETPAPTTPTTPTPPPAPPPPPPTPDPPAIPTGLRISDSGADFIEWRWTPVEGVSGYDVQFSANEAFTSEDEIIARTAEEISYRREDLAAETSGYLRVRSAAGAADDRITSGWSTHVTGTTAAATPPEPDRPAAPSGLEVSRRGDNFIEWSWNAVTGADGYQVQHSGRSAIEDTDPSRFLEGKDNTTFRVPNLDSLTSRYLRVRAYVGTVGEPVFGDWSATERGTTGGPPAPTQLAAPTDLSVGNLTRDSITLEWDEVDDADRYQVQQQAEGASWINASCDDGGNEVTGDTCEATGLDAGTDYNFRVRAVADGFTASAWATTSGETTGSTPTTPITSGSEDLNLKWSNSNNVANQIVWDWDPVADRDDRVRIEHRVAMVAATSQCLALGLIDTGDGDLPATGLLVAVSPDWVNARSATRAMFPAAAGDVYRFCVVRTWVDERNVRDFGEVAEVLAAAPPELPVFPGSGSEITDTAGTSTNEVLWTIELARGFTYQPRLVSLPGDNTPATVNDCGGGRDLTKVSGPARRATATEVFRARTSSKYTRHALCLRAENGDGESMWVVGGDQFITRPAAPALRFARATNQNATLTWSFADSDSVPPEAARYTAHGFASAMSVSSRAGQIAQCLVAPAIGELAGQRPIAAANLVAFANSFEVSYTHTVTQSTGGVGTTTYIYVCVRAETTVGGVTGPWAVATRSVATGQLPP